MTAPTDADAETLKMLDFLVSGMIDGGLVTMADLKQFERRLKRAKSIEAKARAVNRFVEMIGNKLRHAAVVAEAQLPPSDN